MEDWDAFVCLWNRGRSHSSAFACRSSSPFVFDAGSFLSPLNALKGAVVADVFRTGTAGGLGCLKVSMCDDVLLSFALVLLFSPFWVHWLVGVTGREGELLEVCRSLAADAAAFAACLKSCRDMLAFLDPPKSSSPSSSSSFDPAIPLCCCCCCLPVKLCLVVLPVIALILRGGLICTPPSSSSSSAVSSSSSSSSCPCSACR